MQQVYIILSSPLPQVLATCSYVRDKNMYYAACPLQFNGKQCNKKMQDQGGGSWWVRVPLSGVRGGRRP